MDLFKPLIDAMLQAKTPLAIGGLIFVGGALFYLQLMRSGAATKNPLAEQIARYVFILALVPLALGSFAAVYAAMKPDPQPPRPDFIPLSTSGMVTVRGVVEDQDELPVDNARVTIEPRTDLERKDARTPAEGNFDITYKDVHGIVKAEIWAGAPYDDPTSTSSKQTIFLDPSNAHPANLKLSIKPLRR